MIGLVSDRNIFPVFLWGEGDFESKSNKMITFFSQSGKFSQNWLRRTIRQLCWWSRFLALCCDPPEKRFIASLRGPLCRWNRGLDSNRVMSLLQVNTCILAQNCCKSSIYNRQMNPIAPVEASRKMILTCIYLKKIASRTSYKWNSGKRRLANHKLNSCQFKS